MTNIACPPAAVAGGTAEGARVSKQTMEDGRPVEDPRTTAVLTLVAIREASAHLGKLVQLARREVRGNLQALALLVVLFGGALLLVLAALVLFLLALRDALAALIGNEPLAALIVALPFLAATALLLALARRAWRLPASQP